MSANTKNSKPQKPNNTTTIEPLEASDEAEGLDEKTEAEGEDDEDLTDEQLELLESEWVEEALEQLSEIEEHILIKALNRYLSEYDLDPGLAREYADVVATISGRLADMILPPSDDDDDDDDEEDEENEEQEEA
jgi:hypothetical protein